MQDVQKKLLNKSIIEGFEIEIYSTKPCSLVEGNKILSVAFQNFINVMVDETNQYLSNELYEAISTNVVNALKTGLFTGNECKYYRSEITVQKEV